MEQRLNFEGNMVTKTTLGEKEHKETNFRFWRTGEQANLFQGNKGTGTPHLPSERAPKRAPRDYHSL